MGKHLSKKDKNGIYLISAFLFVLMSLIAASLLLRDPNRQYDPDTFCPDGELNAHTIVLIDVSDSFTETQKKAIHNFVKGIRGRLKRYEKLSIFTLINDNYIASIPKFSKCNPGSGKEANELYQNPKKIQTKFDDFFKSPLTDILSNIVKGAGAERSPILEMIHDLSLREDFSFNIKERKLFLVSDMLQHMKQYSHYRRNSMDYGEFKKTKYSQGVTANLTNVSARILYIWRPELGALQNNRHILFWENYFRDMGATIEEIRKAR